MNTGMEGKELSRREIPSLEPEFTDYLRYFENQFSDFPRLYTKHLQCVTVIILELTGTDNEIEGDIEPDDFQSDDVFRETRLRGKNGHS